MIRYNLSIPVTGIFVCLLLALPTLAQRNDNILPLDNPNETYSFIENKGQITDQYGNSRKDIDFRIGVPGINIFVGAGAIHYQWTRPAQISYALPVGDNQPMLEGYRMDVTLDNCNPDAEVVTEMPAAGLNNFYLPQCPEGVTAKSFGKITYRNIYPGIDWVLYCYNNKLKYDFLVHKGADISAIKLTYNGATKLSSENGSYIIETPLGSIAEHAPYSYRKNDNQAIPTSFIQSGNSLSFNLPEGMDEDMVIDPELSWVTYYGGENDDRGLGVTADEDGNVFFCGDTYSVTNIATIGKNQFVIAGLRDAFLVKLDNNGYYKWSTYFGSNEDDAAVSLACDARGDLYAAGGTNGTGMATPGAHQTNYGGHLNTVIFGDGLLAKFNGYNGTRIWSTYYGGTKNDQITSLSLRGSALYISGRTESSNGIGTTGTFKPAITEGSGAIIDAFVARFDTSGARAWGSYFGSNGIDEAYGITTDNFGNIYFTGKTNSYTGITTNITHQQFYGGGNTDAFIAKCTGNGATLTWSTYYGGSSEDVGIGIAFDAFGNIYTTGYTLSDNNISTTGTHQFYRGGYIDGFLTKFDLNGNRLWGTYYGGPDYDVVRGLAVNNYGKPYICGATASTTDMVTPGSYKSQKNPSEQDFFFVRINTSGLREWGSYYGGNGWDEAGNAGLSGSPIFCKNDNTYIAGTTLSSTGISAKNSSNYNIYQPNYGSTQVNWGDGFVGVFRDDAPKPIDLIAPFTDTALCPGDSVRVRYAINTPIFQNGNRFHLELSDAAGNFSNAIIIGTRPGTSGGIIGGVIPANMPPGNYYMVRVVSTSPYYVSNNEGLIVKIKPTPELLQIETNSPVCQGDTLTLKAQNINFVGTVFTWQGPDSVYTGQNITLRKAAMRDSGVYTIEANLNGCLAHDTDTVIVNPAPQILGINNNSPLCEGYTLSLSVIDSAKGATYLWTGPGNFTKSGKNAQLVKATTAAQGTYKVSINIGSCSTQAYVPVFVKEKPGLTGIMASSPACVGATLILAPIDTNNVGTYQWSGPNKFFSKQEEPGIPDITSANSGTYKLVMEHDGCFAEDSVEVTVTPVPKINIITRPEVEAGDSIVLQLETDTPAVYRWVGPNNFRSDKQSPVIPNAGPAMEGTYTVAADLNGCVATATTIISFLVPGENLFVLYPNPNNGIFTIKGTVKQNQVINYDVYDVIGSRIYGSSLTTRSYKVNETITLPAYLSSGVYRIHLRLAGIDKTIGFTINK